MKTSKLSHLLFIPFSGLLFAACAGQKPFDGLNGSTSYSGKLIVTSVTIDPATGPGLVSMWSTDGTFANTLRDLYSGAEYASGSGFISPDKIIIAIDGVDRLEILDLTHSTNSAITNVGLSATPIRQVATSSDSGTILVTESNANTVEKFTTLGARVGAPFLPTTVGACVLSSPWGVTILPGTEEIVVISSPAAAGRFSKYDKDGNCLTHVTAAPFNAGTPTAVAYHAKSGMLLVTFSTTHAIYAVNATGGSPVLIFQNSAIINTPRAIATDADGFVYVGSSGTDTVEKLYWSGSGLATRALSGPLIGPGIFSQNPTSITVIP